MPQRRVLVCGGQNYANKPHAFGVLDEMHAKQPIDRILQGGRAGTDKITWHWAFLHGVEVCHWADHPDIEQAPPTECLAFPGSGTAQITRRARAAGIPIREVSYVWEAVV